MKRFKRLRTWTGAAVLILTLLCTALLRLPAPPEAAQLLTAPSVRMQNTLRELRADALEELTPVRKIYRLSEDQTVAPAPDPLCFGETKDPAEIEEVIALSAALLEGQETVWNRELPFYEEYGMNYYADESILVLVWHEQDPRTRYIYTFAEIKIMDGSQFRRKLMDDAYGASTYKFPTEIARECNAVLGLSGDFYRFQYAGVHVYQRQLCFFAEGIDTCWIDTKGDLHFTRAWELGSKEAAERYITDNDILFTLSFGPVMVENGVNTTPQYYLQGQAMESYPRACLGQLGERHYLAMTVREGLSVRAAADVMVGKGVERCFALDGGQSGTIAMQGVMLNPSLFGDYHMGQRPQSDIIYFATAVPEHGSGAEKDKT